MQSIAINPTNIYVEWSENRIKASCNGQDISIELGSSLPIAIAVKELAQMFGISCVQIRGEHIDVIGLDAQACDDLKAVIFGHYCAYSYGSIHVALAECLVEVSVLLRQVKQMISLLEYKLGAQLPVPKLWIVVRSGTGARKSLACPGLILLGYDKEFHSCASLYRAIAHELIHQWIPGKKYGDALLKGEWLFEALASYLSEQLVVDCSLVSIDDSTSETEKRRGQADRVNYSLQDAHTGGYSEWHAAALGKGFALLCALGEKDGQESIWNIARLLCTNRCDSINIDPNET